MKERPILFSGEMVRAILAGAKTQTRRPVKPQPGHVGWGDGPQGVGWYGFEGWASGYDSTSGRLRCPYGTQGDRLWVRETFAPLIPEHYTDPGRPRDHLSGRYGTPRRNGVAYRSECQGEDSERCRKELGYEWKPSIHMPRWASRLTLEVTGVRVERLDAITEADASAEGMLDVSSAQDGGSLRTTFRRRWAAMYGAGSPFQGVLNPWVWVVEFRRVAAEERAA